MQCHQDRVASASGDYESPRDRQIHFNLELLQVMTVCNIPWKKLRKPVFKEFLQKCVDGDYREVKLPDESTLRKNYLKLSSGTSKEQIASELEGKYVWLSVQETTDSSGHKLNVTVGALEQEAFTKGYVIASKELRHRTTLRIHDILLASLHELWGEKCVDKDKLLLLLTDGGSCMISVGKLLQKTYPGMLHITCLAGAVHSVAAAIKDCFPNIDKVITSVGKLFSKTADHVQLFHNRLPNTPLPPEPVLSRGGAWLKAASYYYRNYDDVKKVVLWLYDKEGVAISSAHEAILAQDIQADLKFVHSSFSQICLAIDELERGSRTSDFSIVNAMNVVFDLRHYLYRLSGSTAEKAQDKIKTVLDENPGFLTLHRIVDLLQRKEVDCSGPQINMVSIRVYAYFKYAPLCLKRVSVEQPFVTLK